MANINAVAVPQFAHDFPRAFNADDVMENGSVNPVSVNRFMTIAPAFQHSITIPWDMGLPPLQFPRLAHCRQTSTSTQSRTEIVQAVQKLSQSTFSLNRVLVSTELWGNLQAYALRETVHGKSTLGYNPNQADPATVNHVRALQWMHYTMLLHETSVGKKEIIVHCEPDIQSVIFKYMVQPVMFQLRVSFELFSLRNEVLTNNFKSSSLVQIRYPVDQELTPETYEDPDGGKCDAQKQFPFWGTCGTKKDQRVHPAEITVVLDKNKTGNVLADFLLRSGPSVNARHGAVIEVKTWWSYATEFFMEIFRSSALIAQQTGVINWGMNTISSKIIKQIWGQLVYLGCRWGAITNGDIIMVYTMTNSDELTISTPKKLNRPDLIPAITGLSFAGVDSAKYAATSTEIFALSNALCGAKKPASDVTEAELSA
ncbi:unnamed protein product [Cyclocybe aegerita]|uniref:Uncharacterized protein n=1 Tax=Cyclocybe aegerita TaxID=1973307 RepID=A0A8S0WD24_CYCAE|nr:unnamed protein product [Cyclocybe aegerita]